MHAAPTLRALCPQYCTIEYTLPRVAALNPPAYVFVVDTCVPEDELAACKTAVQQALSMIPEYALASGGWLQGYLSDCRSILQKSPYLLMGRRPRHPISAPKGPGAGGEGGPAEPGLAEPSRAWPGLA